MHRLLCHGAWLCVVFALSAASAAVADAPSLESTFARLGVDRWHKAGHRGRGVKVAVIDSGFRGYRDYLGRTLGDRITTRSFRNDGSIESTDSRHGVYCAEVIHAIAPDAELTFIDWQQDRPDSFIAAVEWARQSGAKIISCSIIMPCFSDGEGGGGVHAALRRIIGAGHAPGDLLAIACAGNVADQHWSGPFRGKPGGLHQWPSGSTDNHITARGTEMLSVELMRPTKSGYLLQVYNAAGREIGRVTSAVEDGHRSLVLRVQPQGEERFAVRVQHAHGFPGPFHLTVLGGALEHHNALGSIPFPGDGAEWFTVGAWDNDRRAAYSSCGSKSNSNKPDLVARVPFPGLSRDKSFDGTSAAAPQAAGLAALYWSRHPNATVEQVRQALNRAAEDLLAPGHDPETGYGLLRLLE